MELLPGIPVILQTYVVKMKKVIIILLSLILLWGCKTKEYYLKVRYPNKVYEIMPSEEDNEILAELVKKYNSDKIVPSKEGCVTGGVPISIIDKDSGKGYSNSCGLVSMNYNCYIYVDHQEGVDDTDTLVDMVDKYKPLLVSINYYSGSFAEVTDNITGKTVRINDMDWTDYATCNTHILSELSGLVKQCGIYDDKGIESPVQEEYLYTVNLNNSKKDYYFYISENYMYFEDKAYDLNADLTEYVIELLENDGYIGDGGTGVNPR